MKHLYHGSFFHADELKPGIQHTGDLTQWDGAESNAYLYAANDRHEAVMQGICSAIEKTFDVHRTHYDRKQFEIYYEPDAKQIPTIEALDKLRIYLYTLDYKPEDGWQRVGNQQNGLDGIEYKTTRTMDTQISARDTIAVGEYLKDHSVRIIAEKVTPGHESLSAIYTWK